MKRTKLRAVVITCGTSTLALGITACGSSNPARRGHAAPSRARVASAPTRAAAPAPLTPPRLRVVAPRPDARVAPNLAIRVSLTGANATGRRALKYVLDGSLTRLGSGRLAFHGLAPGDHHLVVALAARPSVRAGVSFTVPAPAPPAPPRPAPTPTSSAPTPPAAAGAEHHAGVPLGAHIGAARRHTSGPERGRRRCRQQRWSERRRREHLNHQCEAVERSIAGSAEQGTLYERERAAVEVLHQAAGERAPARLRARIEAQRTGRATPTRWPGYAALAGALAAAAAALALLLPGGTPGGPSVSQAAQLALHRPSAPAPGPDPGDPRQELAPRLEGLYFPNWSGTLGWRPVGARGDRLGGHSAITVYYKLRGMSVAYTIVGAPALAEPSAVRRRDGFDLRTLRLGGRTVVTWRRAGHTCVLSAVGVSTRVLEQLAAWRPAGISD